MTGPDRAGRTARVIIASNRAAAGVYADPSGPVIVAGLRELGFDCPDPVVVAGRRPGRRRRCARPSPTASTW